MACGRRRRIRIKVMRFIYLLKVNAESPPKAVHLWHANTFWNNRRDFRIASLDKPCLTGPVVSIAGYDNLCSNLYVIWTAEVHIFCLLITFIRCLIEVA